MKVMRAAARSEVAGHLQLAYDISERRARQATGFDRSSQRYRKRADPQVILRIRLKELAAAPMRYGYRRLHIYLRREGWEVNHKRTYIICLGEGLSTSPSCTAQTGLALPTRAGGHRRNQQGLELPRFCGRFRGLG